MEYSGGLNPSDRLVIAEEKNKIVGVLRVRGDFRRQGIGKLMLVVAETVIGHRTCYGLAYPHLLASYGRIGFGPVDLSQAPASSWEPMSTI